MEHESAPDSRSERVYSTGQAGNFLRGVIREYEPVRAT